MSDTNEIKGWEYGYGELGDKLLTLFRSGPPDFEAADRLLKLGADINAEGNGDEGENILSKILLGYPEYRIDGQEYEPDGCEEPPHCSDQNPDCGESMIKIIRYFLDNGFDVTKKNDKYGAWCLYAVVLSVFDAHIIEATKILFDAGAKNVQFGESEYDTPSNSVAAEGAYQETCLGDYHLGYIYEAVYQIYEAINDGKPYSGIDSYECARGKVINQILAKKTEDDLPVFYDMEVTGFKHDNCFTETLYFIYDGGALITTKYAELWVDDYMPEAEMVDVSDCFPGIAGAAIESFSFSSRVINHNNSSCRQPIVTIKMDNGHQVIFTINFGEVEDKDRAAYFVID